MSCNFLSTGSTRACGPTRAWRGIRWPRWFSPPCRRGRSLRRSAASSPSISSGVAPADRSPSEISKGQSIWPNVFFQGCTSAGGRRRGGARCRPRPGQPQSGPDHGHRGGGRGRAELPASGRGPGDARRNRRPRRRARAAAPGAGSRRAGSPLLPRLRLAGESPGHGSGLPTGGCARKHSLPGSWSVTRLATNSRKAMRSACRCLSRGYDSALAARLSAVSGCSAFVMFGRALPAVPD